MSWPFLILHLSDLRFGPHSRFRGIPARDLVARFYETIEETRRELESEPAVDLVIVTGDVAEAAQPQEYRAAYKFFEGLTGVLGLGRRQVVFTPGNHDVSPGSPQAPAADRLENFERFLTDFYGQERSSLEHVEVLGPHSFVHRFPKLRLAVAALNSCERGSPLHLGGHIGDAQARALRERWRHQEMRRWLKFVAVHHDPAFTVDEGAREWIEQLRAQVQAGQLELGSIDHFAADTVGLEDPVRLRMLAEEAGVQLVLHGHHQTDQRTSWTWQRNPGQTLVLSAGSPALAPAQMPEAQPMAVRLLVIDPTRGEVSSALRVYEPRTRPEGLVDPGHFVVDAVHRQRVTLPLVRPEGFAQATPARVAAVAPPSHAPEFIADYRRRMQGRHERWTLRALDAAQAGAWAASFTLDEMYLPLRFNHSFRAESLDGEVLTPERLLAWRTPVLLHGPMGSGKTTWMRYTFRRLLEMEEALPFLVELGPLAHRIATTRGHQRTIDAYLAACVAESGARHGETVLGEVLGSERGPRPVLLFDGWDEIGVLGEELRAQLGDFLAAHPRVLAVVSSRPHSMNGTGRSEGLTSLEIQPLSDAEIRGFVERFHRRLHGDNEAAASAASARFLETFSSSPEARSLGRTTWLLVLLLIAGRERPLPGKRHRLYEACLRSLLEAPVQWREREGAQLGLEQWRPEDSEERLRIVAEMAARFQAQEYGDGSRTLIMVERELLDSFLPENWRPEESRGFIAWLVSTAGLLVERADGALGFSHLGFQEYLSAYHLAVQVQRGGIWASIARERMSEIDWWETLRLWAAIVEERSPEYLELELAELTAGPAAGFWVAGAVYADGTGKEGFERWALGLADRFHIAEWRWAEVCARAWAASHEEGRRQLLAATWARLVPAWQWLAALYAEDWRELAGIARFQGATDVVGPLYAAPEERLHVARGRVLGACHPLWPSVPLELGLLRLWPSWRRRFGERLQTLASFGAPGTVLEHAARGMLAQKYPNARTAQYLARYWARGWAPDWMHGWARDWARSVVLDLAWYMARDLARDLAPRWAEQGTQGWTLDGSGRVARDWARYVARDWTPDLARDWARDLELPTGLPWIADAAMVDLAAVGRAGTRAVLAHARETSDPLWQLFRAACRLSLDPSAAPSPFDEALAALPPGTDPLWPALARHLTRRATPADRALLTDLAQHPEQREPPLSWGLQYIVRGDLVLADDSELTLDALWDRIGQPSLPALEDLPDELEVRFG